MKMLVVLAALALALGTAPQAVACDYGAHAANATPIIVATTEEPTAKQPAATAEPAAPKVATEAPPAKAAD